MIETYTAVGLIPTFWDALWLANLDIPGPETDRLQPATR